MKEAKQAKQAHMVVINNGKFLLSGQVAFERAIELYTQGALPLLAAPSQSKYKGYIDNRIKPAFGHMQMSEVNTQAIQLLVNRSNLSWAARNDLRNIISAIFTHARAIGWWAEANPCVGVRCGRKSTVREKRIPTAEGLAKFLDALPDTKICTANEARLIVLVAVVGGLRVSEVLGLQAGDIDAVRQTLTVRRRWHRGDLGQPKSESSKRVRQIGPLASNLLKQRGNYRPTDFLFGREDGNPPDDRALQQSVFRPTAEQVGIYHAGFGLHAFRRLNVTWRQQAGATPIEAQKCAGHASVSMTFLYTQTDEQRERQHVESMWQRLQNTRNDASNSGLTRA
ncbi:MAG TPA: tyrosine-type recombinase/integrase [Bryobacteraceae bacterium]|nr:tyrosine-type recombinase/integrase [Bryobacteraceae bacterium]